MDSVELLEGKYLLIRLPTTIEELRGACLRYDCTVNQLPVKIARDIEEILLKQLFR